MHFAMAPLNAKICKQKEDSAHSNHGLSSGSCGAGPVGSSVWRQAANWQWQQHLAMWHQPAGIPSCCKLSEASQSADFMGRGLSFYCQTQLLVGVGVLMVTDVLK